MNLCENAAMASDKPVLVFSLEMPAEQIMIAYDCLSCSRGPNQKFVLVKIWMNGMEQNCQRVLGCLSKKITFISMILQA